MVEGPPRIALDKTDMAILRLFMSPGQAGQFPTQKARMDAIADVLRLHPNTIAGRLKRMQEGRFWFPFTVLPVPPVVGLAGGRIFLQLSMTQRKPAVLERVLAIPGVFILMDLVEGWDVSIVAEDEARLEAKADDVRHAAGASSFEWTLRASKDWPPMPRHPLDALDIEILGALFANADARMEDVAARTNASLRTVQRHHERLREIGAVRRYPFGEAMPIGVPMRFVHIGLAASGPQRSAAEHSLLPLVEDALVWHPLTTGGWGVLYAEESGELEEKVERIASIPGVVLKASRQFRRLIPNPNWAQGALGLLRQSLPVTTRPA